MAQPGSAPPRTQTTGRPAPAAPASHSLTPTPPHHHQHHPPTQPSPAQPTTTTTTMHPPPQVTFPTSGRRCGPHSCVHTAAAEQPAAAAATAGAARRPLCTGCVRASCACTLSAVLGQTRAVLARSRDGDARLPRSTWYARAWSAAGSPRRHRRAAVREGGCGPICLCSASQHRNSSCLWNFSAARMKPYLAAMRV